MGTSAVHDAHTLTIFCRMKTPGRLGMCKTTVDLLRHGALIGGVRYRGTVEAELSDAGRVAMDAVWNQLADSLDGIVTSPLSRCREPACEWAEKAGISCIVHDDLREMHYGAWEGLSAKEIEAQFPGMLVRWRENPVGMRIPGAETIEDFAARVTSAWRRILDESEGKHILLIAHSGTLRVILTHVLGAPLSATRRFAMPYAVWHRVSLHDRKLLLAFLNRTVTSNS